MATTSRSANAAERQRRLDAGKPWRNWSGNVEARPITVVTPASTADVQREVIAAAEQGRRIRMVGAGHSFTPTAQADDIMLVPDALGGVRSTDPAAGTVTVGAGIDLTTLCLELDKRGLALTNMGDIRVQALGGALQTSTHGTGRDSGTFAEMVRGLELVDGTGRVRQVSAESEPDVFNAARVGIGAFGIITAVTLAVEPAFRLHAYEHPASLPEVLDSFDEWSAQHDHVEFYWFPHTESALVKRNDRTQAPPDPVPAARAWFDDEFLSNTVFGVLCRAGRRFPSIIPSVNQLSGKVLGAREYTDVSWKVFTSPRRVRFMEMEYAIPREALLPTLREIQRQIDASDERVSFPMEVRTVPGDTPWLSTAYGRDTAYIAAHMYVGTPYAAYFDMVEAILVDAGGRPHWGKMHTRTADDLAASYPRFSDALTVRDQLDPERIFANAYTARVLGD